MKLILCLVLAASAAGCSQALSAKPEKTLTTSNKEYPVDLLFTDENGCKVYRFIDNGEYRYYVVGPNGAQMLPTRQADSRAKQESERAIFLVGKRGRY